MSIFFIRVGGNVNKLLFLILLLFFSCSKSEPTNLFVLYVDNQTLESYEIYVRYYGGDDYEFAGMVEAHELSELGKFQQHTETQLQARQGTTIKFFTVVNTVDDDHYTWYLE